MMTRLLSCQLTRGIHGFIMRGTNLQKLHGTNIRRMAHEAKKQDVNAHKFVPFLELMKLRRAEAKRSILVQVQSAQSYKELHSYCSSLGTVKQMLHYSVGVEPMNFIIVEFASEEEVSNALATGAHLQEAHLLPVHSQFLWFRASSSKLSKLKQSKNAVLNVENGNKQQNDLYTRKLLQGCQTISDQMVGLYNESKLTEIGTRLRFLTARQVESALSGMFPQASAFPFGSSVNGCGKNGCDLDLVLRLSDEKLSENARLIFHCKAASGSERTTSQRNMECIGDLIQLFMPGCAQVRRILQARIPIIKYYQQLTDIECDLSMTNMSGVHMSDFLYLMGEMDERIRPLIFTVRKWAREAGLTSPSPGRWITNFSLTLMVLAFLQKPINSPPILPSLNFLIQSAGPKDTYVTDDGINCTFLRDIRKLKTKPTQNKESLESLLTEFFEFYSQFDFHSKAICLNEAVALTKPEHCALYIVNPLERGLNVSKNVSLEELERFKVEARNAAWILESQEDKTENWGLLSIFENKRRAANLLNFAVHPKNSRMMDVSALFQEETDNPNFKNKQIKKEVENIKNENKNRIKEIQKVSR